MASPYNSILFKVEDALAIRLATISTPLTGVGIHKGASGDDLALPYIAVLAESGDHRQPLKGNFGVRAALEIHTSTDDTSRATLQTLVKNVGDCFETTTIAADLSSDLADFRCFFCNTESHSQKVSGNHHIYSINLLVACAPSDV